MSLDNAPKEIKLAIDLIMILEENHQSPDDVLAALEIVKRDFEKKRQLLQMNKASGPVKIT